jgi:hypothetical protein
MSAHSPERAAGESAPVSYVHLYAVVIAALVADIVLLTWLTGYGR